ncbi:MAG: hypothetical protein AB7I30_15705 [Isosphaeraceae bacterium]
MTRRQVFLRAIAPVAAAATLMVAGCGGDETRETGTTVEMTPEDIKGFEAAEESYKNMGKPAAKPK